MPVRAPLQALVRSHTRCPSTNLHISVQLLYCKHILQRGFTACHQQPSKPVCSSITFSAVYDGTQEVQADMPNIQVQTSLGRYWSFSDFSKYRLEHDNNAVQTWASIKGVLGVEDVDDEGGRAAKAGAQRCGDGAPGNHLQ